MRSEIKKQTDRKSQGLRNGKLFFALLLCSLKVFSQETIEVSGFVTDQEKHEPLVGVAVSIKGTVAGTVTADDGSFSIKTKQKLPFTLVFTSVGFAPREIDITTLGSKLQ